MKIVWRVEPKPTGRWRSFEKRGWPVASYNDVDGKPAAFLGSEDEYIPSKIKSGNHAPIRVVVLHHNEPPGSRGWTRYKLKGEFATLAEAKKAAEEFLAAHPDWHPKDC